MKNENMSDNCLENYSKPNGDLISEKNIISQILSGKVKSKIISFHSYGHPNILGTHKNTFEFTKDDYLTLKGDCIIGIKSNFELSDISKILNFENALIIIKCENEIDYVFAKINPNFKSNHEIVGRISNFDSERTLFLHTNKGSLDINRNLINKMKNENSLILIEIISFTTNK